MIAKSPVSSMSSRRGTLSLAGTLCVLGVSALAFAMVSEAAPVEAATLRAGVAQASAIAAGTAKAETDTYAVQILSVGTYTVGKEGFVEITIVPKGSFHINAQYPTKFKTVDPPPENVAYSKTTFVRADGKFTETLGVFKVPFTVKTAGKATVGGKLGFSVCSDANCIMDKVDLELTVDAR